MESRLGPLKKREMSPLKFSILKPTRVREQACIVNSMAFMGVGRKEGLKKNSDRNIGGTERLSQLFQDRETLLN